MELIRFSFARCWRIPVLAIVLTAALSACGSPARRQAQENAQTAKAMWQELCKQSGKKIYRTVNNVEGIYLLKIRKSQTGELQSEYDPYGSDHDGDSYIKYFLHDAYINPDFSDSEKKKRADLGYNYVEAIDPKDGKRYRYTGGFKAVRKKDINAPGVQFELKRNPDYDLNIYEFVLDRSLASGPAPRYGVTYDDITTPEQRKYWIAGSSLRVIDMQTNETIAERIGYMVDLGQGSNGGGRAPWLVATKNACPLFMDNQSRNLSSVVQLGQTRRFVQSILMPSIR